ncbi:hypothetical protein SVAN01_11191 [Stagonosporopsis vannaccii]|nr:hypothetical protein SVAN01_11191 [Stagonosporopsis vannaccii]
MLETHLVLSNARKNAFCVNAAGVRGMYHVATITSNQSQSRHRALRFRVPDGKNLSARKPAGPLTGKRAVPLSKLRSDFEFDPVPSKILTAHPTLNERLERPNLTLTHAQIQNIELGRTLIPKYGSAELAVQALRVAERQQRLQMLALKRRLRLKRFSLPTMLHLWQIASESHGRKVSFAQQQIGIREAALEGSRGIKKQNALFLLRGELVWASTLELLLPFQRHIGLQYELFYMVVGTHRDLQDLGKQGSHLTAELAALVTNLQYCIQQANTPSVFERQYNLIRAPAFNALIDISASLK